MDFFILEIEEDSKVPLILGRPFLHTADVVIRVKQKQLNLGVGAERMTISIDSLMKHSYSNNDTCFSIDVIDEILEEDFDALFDEGSKILYSIECMLAIFHVMIEESMEVFMDDFFVFGNSFDNCLNNLDKMLQRCKDSNLVLNWEKCHFMVKEGIVLTHKVSGACLKVDKAKIDFLEKDTPFEFNDECHKAFNSLKEKLTCTPIIISPNWNLPFELMRDESEFAVGEVLGQKDGKHFYPVYFASKTLNAAQQNYVLTKKELMVVVFRFDKFRPYLVLSKMIVYTDHSTLRHIFKKQDAKPHLICWILLLQEFDIKIKDKKGTKNIATDHLSRIENDETSNDSDVDDNFLGETLMDITTRDIPWFTDLANYLVGDIIPKGMTYQQKNKFFSDLKNYFLEDPYLFKVCLDGMIRRCVSGPETRTILD
ncbi:reverse transcriptase domain-containing protein [Tanacetum coccineum]